MPFNGLHGPLAHALTAVVPVAVPTCAVPSTRRRRANTAHITTRCQQGRLGQPACLLAPLHRGVGSVHRHANTTNMAWQSTRIALSRPPTAASHDGASISSQLHWHSHTQRRRTAPAPHYNATRGGGGRSPRSSAARTAITDTSLPGKHASRGPSATAALAPTPARMAGLRRPGAPAGSGGPDVSLLAAGAVWGRARRLRGCSDAAAVAFLCTRAAMIAALERGTTAGCAAAFFVVSAAPFAGERCGFWPPVRRSRCCARGIGCGAAGRDGRVAGAGHRGTATELGLGRARGSVFGALGRARHGRFAGVASHAGALARRRSGAAHRCSGGASADADRGGRADGRSSGGGVVCTARSRVRRREGATARLLVVAPAGGAAPVLGGSAGSLSCSEAGRERFLRSTATGCCGCASDSMPPCLGGVCTCPAGCGGAGCR